MSHDTKFEVGLPGIEPLIHGTLRPGQIVLLEGGPETSKSLLSAQFVAATIANVGYGVYLTNHRAAKDIRDFILDHSFLSCAGGADEEERLKIIDGYSLSASNERYSLSNLVDLTGMTVTVKSVLRKLPDNETVTFVLDDISTFALYVQPDSLAKSIQFLIPYLKERGVNTFIVLQTGAHDEQFVNTIRYLVDGIFSLKRVEDENGELLEYFRISKLAVDQTARWVELNRTNKGFELSTASSMAQSRADLFTILDDRKQFPDAFPWRPEMLRDRLTELFEQFQCLGSITTVDSGLKLTLTACPFTNDAESDAESDTSHRCAQGKQFFTRLLAQTCPGSVEQISSEAKGGSSRCVYILHFDQWTSS